MAPPPAGHVGGLTTALTAPAAGIDVGAARLHVAIVDAGRRVEASVWDAADVDRLAGALVAAGVLRVGIDSPDALSTLPHAGDGSLAPKFRVARCGEVALGRDVGVWVPWVSPAGPPVPGWIATGMAVFAAVRAAGLEAVETFPHASFRVLAGRPVPAKSRPEGIAARAALLAEFVDEPSLPFWSHDGLDAAVCALVAAGPSRPVTCGHDASAIWVPDPTPGPPSNFVG